MDLLVDGLHGKEANDPRKVWTQFLRIAMSAQRRGWSQGQFISEATKHEKNRRLKSHRLWAQLRASCPEKSAYRQLHKAWECALLNTNNVGERTAEDLRADAVENAYQWADRITEGRDNLSETECAVLGYVISETERRGMSRVTCSSRLVAEAAKVAPITASRHLNSLADRGFLRKFSPGRASANPSKRKAAIYGLGNPVELPQGGMRKPPARRSRKGRGT